MRILAVVVTHNRSSLLDRCLKALKFQSTKPDLILVINNGSTDDTDEVIARHGVLQIKQDNIGSAGGWHTGIQYFSKNKFDACWLMDDDGFPESSALENLKLNLRDTDSCISSCVMKENNRSEFVFPMPRLNALNNPILFGFKRKYYNLNEINNLNLDSYPYAHLFNGALIVAKSVEAIGNINKDYFIMGDEVDYFYRLKTVGNVRTIFSAIHYHPDVSKRQYSNDKIYYLLKNTIINHNKYFDKAMIRNACLILVVMLRVLKRNGLGFFFKLISKRNLLIFSAVYNGFRGKLGTNSIDNL